MGLRYLGNIIRPGYNPLASNITTGVNTAQYQGVFTLQQQAQAQNTQAWTTDALFENTTLLLQSDNAANGSQNNTFLDSSSNAFAITRNGNTTQGSFTPFSPVWSNYFDGTGDYLSIADNAAFEFGSGDFCVELFAYITNIDSDGTLFAGTWNTPNRGWVFGYIAASSELDFNFSTNGTNANSTKAVVSLPLNQWVHFAACRSGNTLSTYMNGARIATRDVTGVTIFAPNQALEIGRLTEGPITWDVIGYISNFRIVKGSSVYNPTQTTINIPTTTLTAITNTTVLTCQSNRFIDNSTNALTVTPNGNVSVQPFSPFAPQYQWTSSVIGGSGYFDGTGDSLTMASSSAFAVGTVFTMECWIYPLTSGTSAGQPLFVNGSTGEIQFGYQGATSWGIAANNVVWRLTSSTMPFVNAWNHVVVVRSGLGTNQTSLFLNGTRVANGTVADTFTSAGTGNIGLYGSGTYTGYISSLRIVKGTAVYDPSLTTCTVPTAPLTAITNTQLLTNFTNAGIYDGTMKNNLETVGNAQVSTAVVKYGSGSLYFDGTGDLLFSPASQNYSFSGDFTIECWINTSTISTEGGSYRRVFATGPDAVTSLQLVFSDGASTSGNLSVVTSTFVITGTINAATGAWVHVALARLGSAMRLFINGVQSGSTLTTTQAFTGGASNGLFVGSASGGTGRYLGYIDDFRITQGIARYTQNFIPPSVALPRQ